MRSARATQTGRFALWMFWAGCLLGLGAACPGAEAPQEDPYKAERESMVRNDIARSGWGRPAVKDKRVLEAMRSVPRHEFVPSRLRDRAYDDRPLPIGHGQTISQPYIVAVMTELLEVDGDDVVFELGSGSGYQAAVLAAIVKEVYTMEIVPELGEQAKECLRRLAYTNVHVKVGDGYNGWPEHGPFDAIIVTAAASHIPPPLIEQLKPGGRMVIPVGPPLQVQQLMVVQKREDGSIVKESVMPVRFVPVTRTTENG